MSHLHNREALQHFENKSLKVSFSHYDIFAHEHAIAFTVAKMMQEDLLLETHRAIQSALEKGVGFQEFQKSLTYSPTKPSGYDGGVGQPVLF